eukprot:740785_1
MEIDLLLKEQQLKEKVAFQKVEKEAQERIIEEQRKKYESVQSNILGKTKETEEAMVKRHEEVMARLLVERERQLWRVSQKTRENIKEQQSDRLEQDYQEKQMNLDRMRSQFRTEEDQLRTKIIGIEREATEENAPNERDHALYHAHEVHLQPHGHGGHEPFHGEHVHH